jgi:NTE family protein
MSFAMVLGAGGTTGEAFHRGVVRAMQDLGCDARTADVVVGTSAGSIVAASLRHRAVKRDDLQPVSVRRRLPSRSSVLALTRRPRQAMNALLLAPELFSGRIDTTFLSEAVGRRHGSQWPDAPLWIVAVRRSDGRRVVFGKSGAPPATVAAAVAASCAIPAYFQAVDIDGASYVDGGVHSPTNADVLAGYPLDLVIVSSPMSIAPGLRPARLDLPLRLLFRRYLHNELWTLSRRGPRVVAIEPDRSVLEAMGLNMMNGRRLDDVEEAAYALARRRLENKQISLLADGTPRHPGSPDVTPTSSAWS